MKTGDRIKKRREELGISVDEVAKKLGKHRATIYRYESNDIGTLPTDVLEPLAIVLETTPVALMGWEEFAPVVSHKNDAVGERKAPSLSDEAMKLAEDYDGRMDDRGRETVRGVADLEVARFKARTVAALREGREQSEAVEEIAPEDIYSIPLYSLPMSAGTGQEAGQEYPEDFLLKKRPPRGTSFIARVSGNSMEPTYYDGVLVFIHASVDIRPGQTGAFLMDGQLWIKELGDGVLISHNPDYGPRKFTEDIRCQGLVLGVCDQSYFKD